MRLNRKIIGILAFGLVAFVVSGSVADEISDGAKVFKKCRACHAVGEGAKDKVGPQLNDLFGRTAGTSESYVKKYSKPMKTAGVDGLVWNAETLGPYLATPKAIVPGTKMTFVGLRKPKDVVAILAYLLTFSPDYEQAE